MLKNTYICSILNPIKPRRQCRQGTGHFFLPNKPSHGACRCKLSIKGSLVLVIEAVVASGMWASRTGVMRAGQRGIPLWGRRSQYLIVRCFAIGKLAYVIPSGAKNKFCPPVVQQKPLQNSRITCFFF